MDAVVSTDRSRNINRRVGNVANLSYDTSTPGGGGAARISVEFNNGEVAYLASEFCIANIPASGNRWKRADFTGAIDNCMFYVSDGVLVPADGTDWAWDNLVYAHPWWRVSAAYVVADAAGDYILDRISLGTNPHVRVRGSVGDQLRARRGRLLGSLPRAKHGSPTNRSGLSRVQGLHRWTSLIDVRLCNHPVPLPFAPTQPVRSDRARKGKEMRGNT